MNVVFWGPVAGKGAVSSSCAATAAYFSVKEEMKCCIIPLNCGNRGAQNAFFSKESDDSLNQAIGSFGVDALLMSLAGGYTSLKELKDTALLIHNRLDYFKASSDPQVRHAEKMIASQYPKIMGSLSKCYDMNFIDAGSGFNPVAARALSSADLLVVCLKQETDCIERLFELCDLGKLPCIYLFTDYDSSMSLSLVNIRLRYRQITVSNSMTLPHCPGFADAINESSLLKWIIVNSAEKKKFGTKKGFADGFIRSLGKISSRIRKAAVSGGGVNDSV